MRARRYQQRPARGRASLNDVRTGASAALWLRERSVDQRSCLVACTRHARLRATAAYSNYERSNEQYLGHFRTKSKEFAVVVSNGRNDAFCFKTDYNEFKGRRTKFIRVRCTPKKMHSFSLPKAGRASPKGPSFSLPQALVSFVRKRPFSWELRPSSISRSLSRDRTEPRIGRRTTTSRTPAILGRDWARIPQTVYPSRRLQGPNSMR